MRLRLALAVLAFLALPWAQVSAQHSTQPLELTYALVEVTHGTSPSVSIAVQQGLPPAGAATHMFGVPTVNVLRYDDYYGPFLKNAGTLHHFRYYVLGIPPQIRVSDLQAGTVTTIRVGDPPLILPGQSGSCGILFPDAHFIGCEGNNDTGWLISATLGHYRKHSGRNGSGYPAGWVESSIGLMPQGNVYGHTANFQGHNSHGVWSEPVYGVQTATLYATYDSSSPSQLQGGRVGSVLLRYVIGY